MPPLPPFPQGNKMRCGQLYTKHPLQPGTFRFAPVTLFGTTLVWLRNMQQGAPWHTMPSSVEAFLLQHRYQFPISDRLFSRGDCPPGEPVALQQTHHPSLDELMWDPYLTYCCRLQGFQPIYLGKFNVAKLHTVQQAFQELKREEDGSTNTYLFCSTQFMGTLGVALRGRELAIFEPYSEITLYTAEEGDKQLWPLLKRHMTWGPFVDPSPIFGVLQLKY